MNETSLSSAQNPKVKAWAGLLDKKNRDRSGQFLVEGVHLVKEALLSGASIGTIVYDAERGIPAELQPLLAEADGIIVAATRAVIAKCTGTDTPPPVFAVVNKPHADSSFLYRTDSLVVVLDGVRDPGNVGTIIRSADAVGADAVVLGKGCVDLYNPKTVRSTMGSLFHLPVVEGDLCVLLPEAKAKGIRLAGTSLQAERDCFHCDWKGPVWLLFGSESDGLSAAASDLLDLNVIIPMRGKAESLNVAMAATVLLYEALRQRSFT
ncbi:TrmH family RNA methyltransferase [Paenibacillus beijingensis]|uniref:rRNA methyltransferase n=1 Tax=Paenibacillus beijingensis TaxID=1126833 RepID=A0A0D5NEZ3_9BACL|nr:RNA methyltransferase [Paenibacillus beijingensis]AJY73806.1 rRNA methyltransferase [Paenibacillus beijingensis]